MPPDFLIIMGSIVGLAAAVATALFNGEKIWFHIFTKRRYLNKWVTKSGSGFWKVVNCRYRPCSSPMFNFSGMRSGEIVEHEEDLSDIQRYWTVLDKEESERLEAAYRIVKEKDDEIKRKNLEDQIEQALRRAHREMPRNSEEELEKTIEEKKKVVLPKPKQVAVKVEDPKPSNSRMAFLVGMISKK